MSKNIRKQHLTNCLISLVVFSALISPIESWGEVAVFSPDIHWSNGETVVADEQAGTADSALSNLIAPMGLPARVDVDALHGLPNGDVLFSLESVHKLGNMTFRPNDVILYDGESWTKELDGRVSGIPDGVNIDAIAKSGELILLSFDIGAVLGSLAVSDSDIIAFDGETFSITLSADEMGIEPEADVDALHFDENGTLIMSFDTAGQVGGIHYRDEDLLALNGSVWFKTVDNIAVSWTSVDLDAWSMVFLRNVLFSNGFEQE